MRKTIVCPSDHATVNPTVFGHILMEIKFITKRSQIHSFNIILNSLYFIDFTNIMFEHTDYGIEFANGSGRDLIDFSNEPQNSPWRVTSPKEEFFVAFER